MAEWLRQWHLGDMKFTIHDLEVMGSKRGRVELMVVVTVSRSYLNKNISCQCISLSESLCV